VDNVCAEYSFLTEFFSSKTFHQANTHEDTQRIRGVLDQLLGLVLAKGKDWLEYFHGCQWNQHAALAPLPGDYGSPRRIAQASWFQHWAQCKLECRMLVEANTHEDTQRIRGVLDQLLGLVLAKVCALSILF
jgi:hypothetical protein